MPKKKINRLKVVLVEKGRTNIWLAQELKKNAATISRWCTNESQPPLITLVKIAEILDVDIRMLLMSTRSNNL